MEQERICQPGKQFGWGFFFAFNFMEVVQKPQSPLVCFPVATAGGDLLLPSLDQGSEGPGRLRNGWPRGRGPPWAGAEGGQAQTNPFSSERLARGTSCRADVTAADAAAAGDSRRAGEPSSPAAGSPPAPYLPRAFPDELTRRERQRQPRLPLRAKRQGKSTGRCSPAPRTCFGLDLGTEIQTPASAHAARATGPPAVTVTPSRPRARCPRGDALSKRVPVQNGDPGSGVRLCIAAAACEHPAPRRPPAPLGAAGTATSSEERREAPRGCSAPRQGADRG